MEISDFHKNLEKLKKFVTKTKPRAIPFLKPL